MNLDNTNSILQTYFNNYRCQPTHPTTYQTQTQQEQIQLPNRNSRVDITITTNKYTLSDLRNGEDGDNQDTLVNSKKPTTVSKKENGDKSVESSNNTTREPSTAGDTSPFDEKKEWAKISEIMESFGSGLVRESVFVNEVEDEFKKRLLSREGEGGGGGGGGILDISVQTPLQAFLNGIGLIHLAPRLEESGFDNVDFLVRF